MAATDAAGLAQLIERRAALSPTDLAIGLER